MQRQQSQDLRITEQVQTVSAPIGEKDVQLHLPDAIGLWKAGLAIDAGSPYDALYLTVSSLVSDECRRSVGLAIALDYPKGQSMADRDEEIVIEMPVELARRLHKALGLAIENLKGDDDGAQA